ncbi:MAG: helix-turn-helix domain-containing protein [Bacillota bacterium]|nr:helix-turn-helix domain-containing protein [Bacillota bacterium]
MVRDEERLLTVDEMMDLLRVGRTTAYELCRRVDFPTIRIGRMIRIPESALLRWLEQQITTT